MVGLAIAICSCFAMTSAYELDKRFVRRTKVMNSTNEADRAREAVRLVADRDRNETK